MDRKIFYLAIGVGVGLWAGILLALWSTLGLWALALPGGVFVAIVAYALWARFSSPSQRKAGAVPARGAAAAEGEAASTQMPSRTVLAKARQEDRICCF